MGEGGRGEEKVRDLRRLRWWWWGGTKRLERNCESEAEGMRRG